MRISFSKEWYIRRHTVPTNSETGIKRRKGGYPPTKRVEGGIYTGWYIPQGVLLLYPGWCIYHRVYLSHTQGGGYTSGCVPLIYPGWWVYLRVCLSYPGWWVYLRVY